MADKDEKAPAPTPGEKKAEPKPEPKSVPESEPKPTPQPAPAPAGQGGVHTHYAGRNGKINGSVTVGHERADAARRDPQALA